MNGSRSARAATFRQLVLQLFLTALFCLNPVADPALPAQAQSKDRVTRLLEELSNAPRPSGFEGPVRDILAREMPAAGLEVSTDGLGSVIGVLHGSVIDRSDLDHAVDLLPKILPQLSTKTVAEIARF